MTGDQGNRGGQATIGGGINYRFPLSEFNTFNVQANYERVDLQTTSESPPETLVGRRLCDKELRRYGLNLKKAIASGEFDDIAPHFEKVDDGAHMILRWIRTELRLPVANAG